MNKHTPGPWRYYRENGSPTTGQHMIAGATPGYLAEVRDCGSGDVQANALLIADSPDLLDALRELLAVAPSTPPAAGLIVGIEQRHRAALDAARAAIKKATGDEP